MSASTRVSASTAAFSSGGKRNAGRLAPLGSAPHLECSVDFFGFKCVVCYPALSPPSFIHFLCSHQILGSIQSVPPNELQTIVQSHLIATDPKKRLTRPSPRSCPNLQRQSNPASPCQHRYRHHQLPRQHHGITPSLYFHSRETQRFQSFQSRMPVLL